MNDEQVRSFGKVIVRDTKQQALERLGVGAGGLFDKDNHGLLDSDAITAEGAPYVFRPTDDGLAFKTWLTNRQITPDEFNGAWNISGG